jgi:hypothetical protein
VRIDLRVQGMTEISASLKAIGRQAPFACSLALNETANAVQSAVQASLSRNFTLRRPDFIRKTIKRERGQDFATKTKLQAAVRVDETRNFLSQHEDGEQKRALSGRNVAIPINVKRGSNGIISTANRPKGLLRDKRVMRIESDRGKSLLVRFTGKGKRSKVDVLYVLKPFVPLRARLGMKDMGERAAGLAWPQAVENAIVNALATAK